jgi:hypothetical protein
MSEPPTNPPPIPALQLNYVSTDVTREHRPTLFAIFRAAVYSVCLSFLTLGLCLLLFVPHREFLSTYYILLLILLIGCLMWQSWKSFARMINGRSKHPFT